MCFRGLTTAFFQVWRCNDLFHHVLFMTALSIIECVREFKSLLRLELGVTTMQDQQVKNDVIAGCELLRTGWRRQGSNRQLPRICGHFDTQAPWVDGPLMGYSARFHCPD